MIQAQCLGKFFFAIVLKYRNIFGFIALHMFAARAETHHFVFGIVAQTHRKGHRIFIDAINKDMLDIVILLTFSILQIIIHIHHKRAHKHQQQEGKTGIHDHGKNHMVDIHHFVQTQIERRQHEEGFQERGHNECQNILQSRITDNFTSQTTSKKCQGTRYQRSQEQNGIIGAGNIPTQHILFCRQTEKTYQHRQQYIDSGNYPHT